jgi:hypothetical protein
MKDSEQLRQLLHSQFLGRGLIDLGDSELLQRLASARQALTPPRGRHALPRVAQGVLAFRVQRQHIPYPDLKYACYGVARPTDWDSRLLLDDAQLFDTLLAAVLALRQNQPRAFLACRRALQQSHAIDIAPEPRPLSPGARQNRLKLEAFLAETAD